jgi:magnesium-transporting ATPase (P-type)
MKPLLNGLLISIILYLVFDIFLKDHTLGLNIQTVSTTLFGNADEFLDPMNKSVFLEFIHMQIFFLMMLLLTLSAVFIRLFSKKKNTVLFMNLLMFFGILSPITLAAAYFYSSEFISIYLLCFFSWHIIALYMALKSLWELNFAK